MAEAQGSARASIEAMAPTLNPVGLVTRVNRDVERSLLRARNGLRYVRGSNRAEARHDAQGDRLAARQGAAVALPQRPGPLRPAAADRHSLVSRSYILDLRPGSSAVEFLRDRGFDVFLLDWGIPDELDADNSLERYVDEYLPRAVAAVRRETGCDELTMAGYCLGGVLAVLYANGHEDARRAQPRADGDAVRLRGDGPDGGALREGRLDPEDLIDETGNVPADVLYSGFFMLAPTTIVAQRATLLENLWNDEFVDGFQAMAQWTRDQVPFPGAAFREVVEVFVRRNALMTGRCASAAARSTAPTRAATCSTRWPKATPSCRGRRPSRSRAGRPTPPARRAAAARRPRHVRDRPLRVPAHPAESRRLDQRAHSEARKGSRDGDQADGARRREALSASSGASRRRIARSSRRTSTTRR